jgi:hypothetical protein
MSGAILHPLQERESCQRLLRVQRSCGPYAGKGNQQETQDQSTGLLHSLFTPPIYAYDQPKPIKLLKLQQATGTELCVGMFKFQTMTRDALNLSGITYASSIGCISSPCPHNQPTVLLSWPHNAVQGCRTSNAITEGVTEDNRAAWRYRWQEKLLRGFFPFGIL